MKYEYIKFMGREHAIPAGLSAWADNHHYYEALRRELMLSLTNRFSDVQHWPANANTVAIEEIRKIAQKHMERLESYGVDSRWHFEEATEAACDELYTLMDKASEKVTNMIIKHIDAHIASSGKPYYYRGPRFEYNSRGILDMTEWFAVESCLSDSYLYLPRNYNMHVGPSRANLGPDVTKYEYVLSYCENVWVPKLRNVVNKYVTRLFKDFWKTLCTYKPMYKGADKHFDTSASELELDWLDCSEDIDQSLIDAFVACPFNRNVYTKCLEYMRCGEDESAAAKAFGVHEPLLKTAKEQCKNTLELHTTESAIRDKLSHFATLIAYLEGGDSGEIVEQHLEILRSRFAESLNEISGIPLESPEFDRLMRSRVSGTGGDIDEIIRVGHDASFLSEVFDLYISKQLNNYEADYYRSKQRQCVEVLVGKARIYAKEAETRREDFYKAQRQHRALTKKNDKEIAALESELAGLPFFKFSQKKIAKNKIALLRQECEDSENQLKNKERFLNEMYLFI